MLGLDLGLGLECCGLCFAGQVFALTLAHAVKLRTLTATFDCQLIQNSSKPTKKLFTF